MVDDLFMVFDVESVGLHGEGFAVGYVVVDSDGARHAEASYACPSSSADGSTEGRAWVEQNVPDMQMTVYTPQAVRDLFWADWISWKERGAVLVADCAWPVEARFLAACVDDDREAREWQGPYPLHELASFLVAAGMDPMANYLRQLDEPQHDPLGDARQSSRVLLMALERLREQDR